MEQDPLEGRSLVTDLLVPGMLAGLLGAFVMAVLAMALTSIFPPHDPWAAARWVAGTLLRDRAADVLPAWASALGIFVHVATSIALATGFSVLLPRAGTALAGMSWGLLYGMALTPLMAILVVPVASPLLHRHLEPTVLFALHLAFGASLGVIVHVRGLLGRIDAARRRLKARLASA